MSKSQQTVCSTRITALEAGGAGLVAGENSLPVVNAVLAAWVGKDNVDEHVMKRAFGEPTLGKNVVIPPGWDTEGKIRAVVDSLGLDYQQLVRLGTEETETGDESVRESNVVEERKAAEEAKRNFLQQHQDWLKVLAEQIDERKHSALGASAKGVEGVAQSTLQMEQPVQSDFFQKLLSGGK